MNSSGSAHDTARNAKGPIRVLIAIPHFYRGEDPNATNRSQRPEAMTERARAFMATLSALHQTFGRGIYGLDHFRAKLWPTEPTVRHDVDIIVCTTGNAHLFDRVPILKSLCRRHETTAPPQMLGFECHRVLAAARGRYDYYGYLEDDIVITDPLFFRKRRLFDRLFGPDALLQPNRYEVRPDGPVQKLYVDYDIRPGLAAPYQDISQHPRLLLPFVDETITVERTNYPSAGCFFLDARQLESWVGSPAFLDGDVSYLSPLDSAVTLSVMKAFRIYKPVLDQAWFFEVLHASPRWINAATQIAEIAMRSEPA